MKNKFWANWHWYLVFAIIAFEALIFIIAGEDIYIGIHDNLDIHITDYQILKLNHAFWSHNKELPFLGGISRDFFLSELSLYSLLYMLFPTRIAYVAGYFLKIIIALFSGILLGREILDEKYKNYEWIIVLGSFTYGLLPLYPAFSFSFSSIPLFIYLIRRIEKKCGNYNFILLFLYPLVSYFFFFGMFLAGYLLVYAITRSIIKRKIQIRLFIALIVLSCGYIVAEHRLFFLFLISGEFTIRDTMVMGSDNATVIIGNIFTVFKDSVFHAEDLHRIFVFPTVLLFALLLNINYIRKKKWHKIIKDYFNLILLLIIFNCIINGLYTCESFRTFIETVIPPLKGWQFDRTVFFNPFLWYLEIVIIAVRLTKKSYKKCAVLIMCITMLVPLGTQSLYNDFYNTVYVHAYRLVKQKESETLSYREFFSEDLFQKIKKDIDYNGEYSAAYGFHPAVLSYNDISTLDGCLSYYPQSYKEKFREIIAPALNESDVSRTYFDNWGARAYIFLGTDESVWTPVRTMNVTDNRLLIDTDAFRELGGEYLFSRIEINNAEELGFTYIGKYEDDVSPYTIWVWRLSPKL
ncbi:MAG: DUF6044 family protein [Clostridiales bacterium]|nr:DUF6044 family protein [Clostridiales bacterium]